MRHLGAGLAIPDFPLAFGRLIPSIGSVEIATNFAHRTFGMALALVIVLLAPMVFRRGNRFLRINYAMLLMAVMVQILLGAYTIWSEKAPVLTSFHVMTGAFIFATTIVFALAADLLERPSGAPVPLGAREALA